MAGKSSKGGGGFSKSSGGGGFSKSSGGSSSSRSSGGSSWSKSSSPSSPSSQRSSGGSPFGGLFSGSGSKSPARKTGDKGPKGGGGFGSWRAPNAGGTLFGRSYGQSQGGQRGCMGCGCVVAIATLLTGLGGLATVLIALG